MTNPSPDISHEEYIQRGQARQTIVALTAGDVVYIRILKCASTFFHNNFTSWGWTPIRFESIDWNKQRVFAHMLDPRERRYKGAAEYINMNNLSSLVFDNADFRKFIATIPVFDDHTASYHSLLGPYCRLIDWIPISGRTNEENCHLTELLLWDHNIRVLNRWNQSYVHQSTPELKALQTVVKQSLEESYQDGVYRYLLDDCVLYDRVCRKFNAAADRWCNISWLR